MSDINAFDAKTHFSQLLRDAEQGRAYTIRRRGKPVARLVPCETTHTDYKALAAALRELRKRVKGKVDVRKLIGEGRRV